MQKQVKYNEQSIRLMAVGNRRLGRRFGLRWMAVVRGVDQSGKPFQEFCFLKNLSSTGACVDLKESVASGAVVELDVRTPLSQKRWLRYFGKVIYVGGPVRQQTIGLRFESAKPAFIPIEAVTQFSGINRPRYVLH